MHMICICIEYSSPRQEGGGAKKQNKQTGRVPDSAQIDRQTSTHESITTSHVWWLARRLVGEQNRILDLSKTTWGLTRDTKAGWLAG